MSDLQGRIVGEVTYEEDDGAKIAILPGDAGSPSCLGTRRLRGVMAISATRRQCRLAAVTAISLRSTAFCQSQRPDAHAGL